MKIVWWGGASLCLAKRLEKAAFCWPRIGRSRIQFSTAQLPALPEGMDWKRVYKCT
ncbi:transposase [Devosia salina]|uniref:Transposase n=1 Tax=Devosia salina TaxID=2860336 RepID=A0ABX8WN23_9HYPH|nr:transposase [Devosia salina]